MELYEIRQNLNSSKEKLKSLGESLDLEKMQSRISELNDMQSSESFWNDPKEAQKIIKEYNTLKDLYESYLKNERAIDDLLITADELNKVYDAEMSALLEEEYLNVTKDFEDYEIRVLLSNDYDHSNAILEIHPGAGGTESQDWAMMLYRMYQRYAQKNGYSFEVLDYQDGDEAGMKSCSV
ncbi:MAG: PCRF domain-containing protein, partial [Erysipelotrichaceae bacterium]